MLISISDGSEDDADEDEGSDFAEVGRSFSISFNAKDNMDTTLSLALSISLSLLKSDDCVVKYLAVDLDPLESRKRRDFRMFLLKRWIRGFNI